MRLLGLLLLFGLLTTAFADPLYKWVDEQGHVHYSQTPPPSAVTKVKPMDLQVRAADPAAVQAAQDLAQQQLTDHQVAQQLAEQKAEQDAERKQQVQQDCDALRSRLQLYQQAASVFTVDAQGNRHYESDEDHLKKEQELQDLIQKYCSDSR